MMIFGARAAWDVGFRQHGRTIRGVRRGEGVGTSYDNAVYQALGYCVAIRQSAGHLRKGSSPGPFR